MNINQQSDAAEDSTRRATVPQTGKNREFTAPSLPTPGSRQTEFEVVQFASLDEHQAGLELFAPHPPPAPGPTNEMSFAKLQST